MFYTRAHNSSYQLSERLAVQRLFGCKGDFSELDANCLVKGWLTIHNLENYQHLENDVIEYVENLGNVGRLKSLTFAALKNQKCHNEIINTIWERLCSPSMEVNLVSRKQFDERTIKILRGKLEGCTRSDEIIDYINDVINRAQAAEKKEKKELFFWRQVIRGNKLQLCGENLESIFNYFLGKNAKVKEGRDFDVQEIDGTLRVHCFFAAETIPNKYFSALLVRAATEKWRPQFSAMVQLVSRSCLNALLKMAIDKKWDDEITALITQRVTRVFDFSEEEILLYLWMEILSGKEVPHLYNKLRGGLQDALRKGLNICFDYFLDKNAMVKHDWGFYTEIVDKCLQRHCVCEATSIPEEYFFALLVRAATERWDAQFDAMVKVASKETIWSLCKLAFDRGWHAEIIGLIRQQVERMFPNHFVKAEKMLDLWQWVMNGKKDPCPHNLKEESKKELGKGPKIFFDYFLDENGIIKNEQKFYAARVGEYLQKYCLHTPQTIPKDYFSVLLMRAATQRLYKQFEVMVKLVPKEIVNSLRKIAKDREWDMEICNLIEQHHDQVLSLYGNTAELDRFGTSLVEEPENDDNDPFNFDGYCESFLHYIDYGSPDDGSLFGYEVDDDNSFCNPNGLPGYNNPLGTIRDDLPEGDCDDNDKTSDNLYESGLRM